MLGLYARALEQEGISTAMITLLPEVTDKVGVPRSLHVPFQLGKPCGEPFDSSTRRSVLLQLLNLLKHPSKNVSKYRIE
ncbi:hypothetical protein [Salirhabdus salicampi]|uniref:hypothetical protein n=1 Tax=Salirhabdus salicampi TaxID=476102 RepID=UPI0020C53BD8|nr:hypothetical protein [Salirhabdus salicampi]MCP8616261.1 hypothetical protein [Salirhabdus salicampi]